jgi:hypothetical protein
VVRRWMKYWRCRRSTVSITQAGTYSTFMKGIGKQAVRAQL